MDNPALKHKSDNSSADGLPPTHSSQQLVPSSDAESVTVVRLKKSGRGGRLSNLELSFLRSNWFTVAVLCFVNLLNYMDRYTTAGVLDNIQDDFQIGDDEGGLLQTAFILSYMICAPIFGYLGDRYSRRWIMAISVLLWSATTLLGSYMPSFGWFITFRALVGVGEASYSTIAPTIISDLFVHEMRSKMLALFYFAIPVGCGFGYIVGSETARIAQDWRWALRVTPFLGIAAVVLILLIQDPERGESEGSHRLQPTTYKRDIVELVKNRSFMFSTAGFTCVAFVAGALSWWGPKFIFLGLRMQPGNENLTQNDVAFKFGAITMIAGIVGVPLGSILSQRFVKSIPRIDPYLCAIGLIAGAPLITFAMIIASSKTILTYVFIFFGQLLLNLNWAIIADILLYVVIPTRRSTAEAFQVLISHALGDAGSPYLVGVLSEALKKNIRDSTMFPTNCQPLTKPNATELLISTATTTDALLYSAFQFNNALDGDDTNLTKFEALKLALFSTSFVEVLGGVFFLLTAAFILRDKNLASQAVHEGSHRAVPSRPPVDVIEISSLV